MTRHEPAAPRIRRRVGHPQVESWADRDVVELFERERRESLQEEGRLLVAEVACLVLVVLFILVRQLWLI